MIVSILSAASESGQIKRNDAEPVLERVERLRVILEDLIEEIDPDELPPPVSSDADTVPIGEFRRSLPDLQPPLSATVSNERDDRR